MIRPLAITAAASFVVAILGFAGAAALAGPELTRQGFWRDFAWNFSDAADEVYEASASDQTQTRTLTDFTSVSVGAVRAEITIAPDFKVEVIGADPSTVETSVSGGELSIEPARHGFWRRGGRGLVKISMPSLQGISAAAGAGVRAEGLPAAANLDVEASSGADVTLKGACQALNVEVSTGASVDASELACTGGDAEASTGGEMHINVAGPLNVEASTGGAIYAQGDAKIGEIDLSSGGAFERK